MPKATRLATLLGLLPTLLAAQSPVFLADRKIQGELIKKLPIGTVLTIQKPGIVGASVCSGIPTADYKDGQLHRPSKLALTVITMAKCLYRDFPAGWKVTLANVGANVKNGKVTLVFFECDSCNGTGGTYRGAVSFQFPKGSLDSGSLGPVQDAIAQVFATDTSTPVQSVTAPPTIPDQPPEQPAATPPAPNPTIGPVYVSAANAANRLLLNADGSVLLLLDGQPQNGTYAVNGASVAIHLSQSNTDLAATADGAQLVFSGGETWVQPGQPPATAAPPAPSGPSTTNIGDTIDQVTSRLGAPDQILNAGTKVIYLYKSLSLKITFTDGRVSSID